MSTLPEERQPDTEAASAFLEIWEHVQALRAAVKAGYVKPGLAEETALVLAAEIDRLTALAAEPAAEQWMPIDSDRLKPCPFCGSDAEFGEIGEGQDAGGHFVQCLSSACGASSALIFPLMDDVKALLMERWNKRTDNAPRTPDAN
jgi:Lar family restriction alleviation protein